METGVVLANVVEGVLDVVDVPGVADVVVAGVLEGEVVVISSVKRKKCLAQILVKLV